jgi:hypothetical protein
LALCEVDQHDSTLRYRHGRDTLTAGLSNVAA